MRLLRLLRDWNVAASVATTPSRLWEARGFAVYDDLAHSLIAAPDVRRVIDVGAGRSWQYGEDAKLRNGLHLIGVDIDQAELKLNPMLDERHQVDACASLPGPSGGADLILSRAVVEHLHDTEGFVRNAFWALRPGGQLAVVFAGKWSPPTIINRALPHAWSRWLLLALVPGSEGIQGFRAYYDRCSDSEFRKVLETTGFEISRAYSSYYSSSYFQFFLPLHALSICGDYLRAFLGIPDLASMHLYVARKPA